MKIGLQIPDFSTPRGPERLGAELATVARTADDAGFEYIAVMDHFFQIPAVGPAENEMLEGYTTLGYLAACTRRAALLTVITGVHYREPGILAKIVTTLDVLSNGRAWLGVGAGWNEEESRGLGVPFPPVAERFERLEETLQICLQMWHGDEQPYQGKHYTLERPLNSPQSMTRPHPPIMIGGGGEKKTLRMVAQYADACNLFAGRDEARKLDVLRQHCEAVGRDYDTIYKTAYYVFDPSRGSQRIDRRARRAGRARLRRRDRRGRRGVGRGAARGDRGRGHPGGGGLLADNVDGGPGRDLRQLFQCLVVQADAAVRDPRPGGPDLAVLAERAVDADDGVARALPVADRLGVVGGDDDERAVAGVGLRRRLVEGDEELARRRGVIGGAHAGRGGEYLAGRGRTAPAGWWRG